MVQTNSNNVPRRKGFLYKFRWSFYAVFIALMVFVAVCMAVGVVSNLKWRYADMDIPMERPESLEEIRELRLHDCLAALEQLHRDLRQNVDEALEGGESRAELLRRWREWNREWRLDFEKVGFSCRLTELRYDKHHLLGLLAGIYRILDSQQGSLDRMVRSFILENARELMELHALFQRVHDEIDLAAEEQQQ